MSIIGKLGKIKLTVPIIILILILSSGCLNSSTQQPAPTSIPIDTPEVVASTIASTPMPVYDDKEFLAWMQSANKILQSDLLGALDAIRYDDLKSMEIYGRYLKEDSQKYLDEIDKFTISPKFTPVAEEFKRAIENQNLGGKYLESGAKNADDEALNRAADYLSEAEANIRRTAAKLSTAMGN